MLLRCVLKQTNKKTLLALIPHCCNQDILSCISESVCAFKLVRIKEMESIWVRYSCSIKLKNCASRVSVFTEEFHLSFSHPEPGFHFSLFEIIAAAKLSDTLITGHLVCVCFCLDEMEMRALAVHESGVRQSQCYLFVLPAQFPLIITSCCSRTPPDTSQKVCLFPPLCTKLMRCCSTKLTEGVCDFTAYNQGY